MASTEVADLPEDVLFEVFSRVGKMKSLFRCAVTCKRWLSVFTDPEFLRRLWPEEDRGRLLLGFFLDGVQRQGSTLAFVPAPSSPIGYGDCILTPFVPDDHDLFHSVTPLASHRGILLLRFVTRSLTIAVMLLHLPLRITCIDVARILAELTSWWNSALSNKMIMAKTVEALAFHPLHIGHSSWRGILLDAHLQLSHPRSCSSIVGRDGNEESRDLHIHLYSRATSSSWSVATADCILPSDRARELGATAAVVHRGVANWLYDDEGRYGQRESVYMLSVKAAGTTRVSLTKLPIRDDSNNGSMFLCTGRDGRLSIACVHELRVDVWTTHDDDDGESNDDDPLRWQQQWHKVHEIQIPAGANFSSFRHCAWKCLNSGTLLFLVKHGGCKNHVFVLNLETAAVEKVLDLSESPHTSKYYSYMPTPYKMDLPEFFLGQLGNHHQKRLLIT
ncbi:hypothetical protein PR202_gb03867 [Eleusine coracana subsp. coracana]|uniref:F-box domain-containing protein n=1 Tax=Eleusine coracana subsp. coracana TaxID=191504 RepID=A0AAV5E0L6_ELECO|nr:hypothetical protein PR202_gb03867 [Eleusine coracana subsp. coracana]